jgi:hypothetical protein
MCTLVMFRGNAQVFSENTEQKEEKEIIEYSCVSCLQV